MGKYLTNCEKKLMLVITLSPAKGLYNYVEDINFLVPNVIGDFKVESYILEGKHLITVFTTTFLLRVPMAHAIAKELCTY